MKTESIFVYVGTYANENDARSDYDVLKDLHATGTVGTYDAAVVTRDEKGKVHVNKDETATRYGVWAGAVVGALVGILFPPVLIVGTAALGAAVGGVTGHIWRGLSRADVKDLGEIIDAGEAALVVVGEDKLEEAVERSLKRAVKHVAKELEVSPKELDDVVRAATEEIVA